MKNAILLITVLMMGSVMSGISAHAEDQSSGCGLGWMIFKKNSLVSSSLRATTNAFALNTIAMTVGTSGCAKHDIVMKEKEALYFAEANYQKLINEMAEGKGEHLQAFAKVLGCDSKTAARAGGVFQRQYETIFTSDQVQPQQLLNNIANAIGNSEMAIGCGYQT